MKRISTRSIIAILLVVGFFVIAVIDPNFRSGFADIAKVGIGGYIGQLVPKHVLEKVAR